VLVGAAANLAVDIAGEAGADSFVESSLNALTFEKLHVEIPGEQETDVVEDLRFRIDRDDDWNVTIEEDVTDFFWVTRRDES